jgi:diketogulonate reductase-like aldo/keto reductase
VIFGRIHNNEQGATPIVKIFNKERMKQKAEIFDWKLNQEELNKINQIPQCRFQKAEMFVYDNGPYKSLEELWVGDV